MFSFKNVMIIVCFIVSHTPVFSDQTFLVDKATDARVYFETTQYEKAVRCYKEILQQEVTPAQKALISFNLGTVLLAQNQFNEALSFFERIVLSGEDNPLLLRRLYTNMATAYFEQAHAIDNELTIESEKFLQQWELALGKLGRSLEFQNQALKAEKQLILIQGGELKDTPKDLEGLKKITKERIVSLKEKKKDFILNRVGIEDGFPLLKENLENSLTQLESIGTNHLSGNHSKYAIGQQYVAEKKLLPFVEKVESRIQDSLKKAKQIAEDEIGLTDDLQAIDDHEEVVKAKQQNFFFSNVRNHFLSSLESMQEFNVWQTHESQMKALLPLKFLLRLEKKEDPLAGILNDRISLASRMQTEKHSELINALRKEEVLSRDFAYALATELTNELEKKIQEVEHTDLQNDDATKVMESEALELTVFKRMTENLKQRLEITPDNNSLHQETNNDLILYHQLGMKEEDSLLKIYDAWNKYIEISQSNLLPLQGELWALLEQFRCRTGLGNSAEQEQRICRVIHYLDQALAQAKELKKESETQCVSDKIERALLEWCPQQLLSWKLNQLEQDYETLEKEKKVSDLSIIKVLDKNKQLKTFAMSIGAHEKSKADLKKLSECLQYATDGAESALMLHGNTKIDSCRVMISDAKRWVQRAYEESVKDGERNSIQILENGVNEESHALTTNNRVQDAQSKEKRNAKLLEVTRSTQQVTLPAVDHFIETAIAEERCKRYGSEEVGDSNLFGEEELRQCEPWSEVLDLYNKGVREALLAEVQLDENDPDFVQIEKKQALTLQYWKEALDKLRNPDDQDQNNEDQQLGASEDSSQNQDQDSLAESGSTPEEAQASDRDQASNCRAPPMDILELLQQMESDDQINQPETLNPKSGLRPW